MTQCFALDLFSSFVALLALVLRRGAKDGSSIPSLVRYNLPSTNNPRAGGNKELRRALAFVP